MNFQTILQTIEPGSLLIVHASFKPCKAADPVSRRNLLIGGFWCGVVLAAGCSFQQYGLKYTTAGKTGFLTALYIVIVPLLGIFFKRRTSPMLWLAVLLALL